MPLSVTEPGFTPLFDGVSLTGWRAIPRTYGRMYPGGPRVLDVVTDFPADYNEQAEAHPAAWTIEDGAIVGRQDPPGSGWGGYLITQRSFGDFDLRLEANPDWPADTGVMLRRRPDSWEGLQVLIDHRQSGSIGGFYGNGIGAFHAVPFALDAVRDAAGKVVGLRGDDPATTVEPFTATKRAMLTRSADLETFLATWRFGDWNEFRIRCVGGLPLVTVWINDLLVAEIDLGTLEAPNYARDTVSERLGPRGHIALEFTTRTRCWANADGATVPGAVGATSASVNSEHAAAFRDHHAAFCEVRAAAPGTAKGAGSTRRRVHLAGITAHPNGALVAQACGACEPGRG